MRAAALATLCGVAGCDGAFDLVRVGPGPDASPDASSLCIDDMFEGTALDPRWAKTGTSSGVAVRVEGGLIQIDVPAQTNATDDPYGGIRTVTFDMSAGSVEADIVQPPGSADKSLAGVQVIYDGSNHYDLFVQQGLLVGRSYISGIKLDTSTPYLPEQHRVVRIRHDTDAGEIVFEARGEATDWHTIARRPLALDLSSVFIVLFAASFDVAPAYTAQLDNALVFGSCAL